MGNFFGSTYDAENPKENTPLLQSTGSDGRPSNILNSFGSPAHRFAAPGKLHKQEDENKQGQLSFWTAVFTIMNIFLGLGVLSLPYAFSKGSIYGIFFLLVVGVVGYATALLLVRATATLHRYDYGTIAEECFDKPGTFACLAVVLLELCGAVIITVLFLWDNLFFLLHHVASFQVLALISAILVTPTVWLLNFEEMGGLNLIGIASNVVFCITTLLLCFIPGYPKQTDFLEPPEVSNLSLGMGIFLLCFAGHPCIPPVYKEMKDKSQTEAVLKTSFSLMVVLYSVVGVSGCLLYGNNVHALFTQNLTAKPGGSFVFLLVTILITLRSFVSISPLLGLVAELFENSVFGIHAPNSKRTFRTGLLWIFVVVAYLVQNHVDYVEAITGSMASILSVFVLPPVFYMASVSNVGGGIKYSLYLLIFVACCLAVLLTGTDVKNLLSPVTPVTNQ